MRSQLLLCVVALCGAASTLSVQASGTELLLTSAEIKSLTSQCTAPPTRNACIRKGCVNQADPTYCYWTLQGRLVYGTTGPGIAPLQTYLTTNNKLAQQSGCKVDKPCFGTGGMTPAKAADRSYQSAIESIRHVVQQHGLNPDAP